MRYIRNIYQDKPSILLSASPGPRGGGNALAAALASASHVRMDVKGSFSCPRFYDNFDLGNGRLINDELQAGLEEVLSGLG